MSMYFDLVINCDLREDISSDVIEAIRCLMSHEYKLTTKPQLIHPLFGNIWDTFGDHHFLAPDPAQGVISNLVHIHHLTIPLEENREVWRYRLQYCGRNLHEDWFHDHHLLFAQWLQFVTHDSLIGYYMGTGSALMGLTWLLKVPN